MRRAALQEGRGAGRTRREAAPQAPVSHLHLHRAVAGLSYSPQTCPPETQMHSVNLQDSRKPQKRKQ